jgi:serine/threonine-protein kinase
MAPEAPTEAEGKSGDPFELCGVTIADKYRVVSVVGSGGFGVVYRAVHTGFGEPVAVKCIKLPGELGERERSELLTRLQDEGRVLHRLSKLSSGIVQALDVGAVTSPNGQWLPYLVMEWLEGETLAGYLRARLARGEGALSIVQAIELLEPAARALEVAHRQKVAHRDVKPENLCLVEVAGQRTVKVLDFGIAKVLAQHATFTAAPAATQKAASAFTPSYGAPEQFNKKRGATGPWTDVFALALILVEAVSGERALEGDDATQLYIAAADPAARPTLRHKGVQASEAVEDVLARALAVEPADRYQDAGAFWNALREASGKKARSVEIPPDVSETGEFVSRHEIGLEPAALSERKRTPAAISDKKRTPDTSADAEEAPTQREQGQREPAAREPARATPAASARPPVQKSVQKPRSQLGMPRNERRAPPPSTTTTIEPTQTNKWLLPTVVVLALGGAGLLYMQLRQIGPEEGNSTSKSSLVLPSGSAGRLDQADAGTTDDLDGGADADADAGVEFDPPKGMVFVQKGPQPEDGGFFLDKSEVTLDDYKKCVSAGRCVSARRVVLTEESAQALGVEGVDDTTTPEQLASAWGSRCNELRGAGDHPVNCVNHATATDYCRFVEKRLPTSEEFTMAAGGSGRKFPWGDAQPECTTACFGLNSSCLGSAKEIATCTSGSRQGDVTPEGIVDLAGNVAEWVSDEGKGGSGGPWRVLRGGSFNDEAERLKTTSSRSLPAVTAHVTIGFRCAIDPPEGWLPPGPQ